MGGITKTCCNTESQRNEQFNEHVTGKTINVEEMAKKINRQRYATLPDFDYGTPEAGDDEKEGDVVLEERPETELQGGIKYTGEWVRETNVRHGKGRQSLPDGSCYEGWWRQNKANGRGRFIDASGLFYEGMWKDDMKHGEGRFEWPDGRVYEGSFEDNMFCGRGKLTLPNGETYEGHWKANQMDGHGVFAWPDGRKYEGEFSRGKQHGTGKYYTREGKVKEGVWENGKRQKQEKKDISTDISKSRNQANNGSQQRSIESIPDSAPERLHQSKKRNFESTQSL